MRTNAVLASLAVAGIAAGALGSCVTARGGSYAESLFDIGAPNPNDARIVFLRPDQRYDDASLSRMVIRVDDRIVGKLAYGGFLIEDVSPGEVVLEISADNRFYGTCKLPLRVVAGETKYFDAKVRPTNIAAGAIGVLAGGAAVGGASPSPAEVAAGSVAGNAVASAAESAGKTCGGPYRFVPLEPAVALKHLDRLRASE
jgi:hypothetical protein